MDEPTPVAMLATAAAGLGAAFTVAKYSRRVVAFLAAPYRWWVRQDKAAADTARICLELAPVGGQSLRDVIVETNNQANLLEQMVRAGHADAPHGIFHTDSVGWFVWVNPAYCRLVGRAVEDICGEGWKSYVHPDDRARVVEEWRNTVAGKREFSARFRLLCGDTVDASAHVLRDRSGRLLGYQGSVRPTPEAVAAEVAKQLRRSSPPTE